MKAALSIAISLSLFVIGTAAHAAAVSKIPANAVPLTETEVLSLYQGKTETYRLIRQGDPRFEFKTYYEPDKKIIGYYDDYILPTRSNYTDGSWSANRNKICTKTNKHLIENEIIQETFCHTLFRVGAQIWIGTPADSTDGNSSATKWTYDKFDDSGARLTNGNSAQQRFQELQKAVADGFKN